MLPSNVLEWLWHQLEFNYSELTRVYREVVDCLELSPSLRPRTDVYTTEQGLSDLLLVLYGPLPANIQGKMYGIPVEIWIPKQYPMGSPVVFVRPTTEMRINANNRVDSNGRVYFEWDQNMSILGLCETLSHNFGLECPVYTVSAPVQRRAPPVPVETRKAPRNKSHIVANIMDSELPSLPQLPERPADSWNQFETALKTTFDEIVASEVNVDLAALRNTREVLDWMKESLSTERDSLNATLDFNQRSMTLITEDIKAARSMIAEAHSPASSLLTADDLVTPNSQHAKLLIESMAQDAALGDTIIALASGFAHERLELDAFLKHTRSLARRQFMERHRADTARRSLVHG